MASKKKKKKKSTRKKRGLLNIILVVLVLLGGIFYYVSYNINQIISSKITEIYGQSQLVDYYDFNFSKIRVNILKGNIKIYHISFVPKKDIDQSFFEKNGNIRVDINKIILKGTNVYTFISDNRISISEYSVRQCDISITNLNNRFKPFAFIKSKNNNDSLSLWIDIDRIDIENARFNYITNKENKFENSFQDFNLKIQDFSFINNFGQVEVALSDLDAYFSRVVFHNEKGISVSVGKLEFDINRLKINNSDDSFNYEYGEFFIKLKNTSLNTKNNLYNITTNELVIDELNNNLEINGIKITPKLNKSEFAHKYKYQTIRPEIEAKKLYLTNITYSDIIHYERIIADSLIIDGVEVDLYKDKTVAINKNFVPNYLAKQIFAIKMPIDINVVKANDIDIYFTAKQENKTISKIDIQNLNGYLLNVQNKNPKEKLKLFAEGKIHNTIPFDVSIDFDYSRDYFKYKGRVFKSDLHSISSVIRSFAPTRVQSGRVKSIDFYGFAGRTESKGKMIFLYNDLKLDLDVSKSKNSKNFQNFIFSTAANTILYTNNPLHEGVPTRKVEYKVVRDMNKGFINLLVKSVLMGAKESVIPSKENRKAYKETKRNKRKKRQYQK